METYFSDIVLKSISEWKQQNLWQFRHISRSVSKRNVSMCKLYTNKEYREYLPFVKKEEKNFRFGKRNVKRNMCPASVAKLFHATTECRTSTINSTNLLGCRQYHHYFDIVNLSNIVTSQEADEFHHIKMPLHDRSITIHLLFITGIHNLAENISSNIFVSSFFSLSYSSSFNRLHFVDGFSSKRFPKAQQDLCLCFLSISC